MWEPGRAVLSPLGAPQSTGWSRHFSCLCGLFRKLKSAKSRLASGSAHCSEVDALSEATEGMLLFPQRGASSSQPSSLVWNGERKEILAPARDPPSGSSVSQPRLWTSEPSCLAVTRLAAELPFHNSLNLHTTGTANGT